MLEWSDKFKHANVPVTEMELWAISNLSPREAEVFQHLMSGEKMKDIAEVLGIRTSTVNGYCRQIYRQL